MREQAERKEGGRREDGEDGGAVERGLRVDEVAAKDRDEGLKRHPQLLPLPSRRVERVAPRDRVPPLPAAVSTAPLQLHNEQDLCRRLPQRTGCDLVRWSCER